MRALFLLLLVVSFSSFSQNWNLNQCLSEALASNFGIKSQKINEYISKENLKTTKYSFLPSINAGATHGYNWGQTIDPFTNQFATNQVQSNSFYLSSSLSLFNGLQRKYDLDIKNLDVIDQTLTGKIRERNLKIDIATTYFQALLNNEVLELAQQQYQLTKEQSNSLKLLIENGNEPNWKLEEVVAQIKSDKYLVLKAQNDLNYSLLLLQHAMGKKYNKNFNILKVDSSLVAISNRSIDVSKLPEIEQLTLTLNKKEIEIKASKARVLPSLNANGSLGTGYSGNNKAFDANGVLVPKPFRDQIGENFYQSVSFNLSIPIFNQFRNKQKTNIEILRLKQQKLDLEQQKFILTQKLEKLNLDISSGKSQLAALKEVLKSSDKNLENYLLQFKLGTITNIDLQIQKDKLFQAQSNLLQAKYKLFLNQFILSSYQI